MSCRQELCINWAGDAGCPCNVLDLEPACGYRWTGDACGNCKECSDDH